RAAEVFFGVGGDGRDGAERNEQAAFERADAGEAQFRINRMALAEQRDLPADFFRPTAADDDVAVAERPVQLLDDPRKDGEVFGGIEGDQVVVAVHAAGRGQGAVALPRRDFDPGQ